MPASAGTIPVAHVLRVLRKRWPQWLLVVLLTTLVGLVAALVIPRRYEAEVVGLPRSSERGSLLNSLTGSDVGGLAALAGLGGENEQRAEAVEMLQSHIVAREFVQDAKLLPVLFASDWDERRKVWSGRTRTINDAVELFDRRIRDVIEDRRTGLVTLRITWKDPEQAASWANELVRRANEKMRQRAAARAQKSIDYLKREARNAETIEIQQSLYQLMEQQYNNLLLANVTEDYGMNVIDPAFASDPDQYVFPKIGLFTFGGLFFGVVLVLIAVFMQASQQPLSANQGNQVR